MAAVSCSLIQLLVLLTAFLSATNSSVTAHPLKTCNLDRMYQFGDSLSDTGNLVREFPIGSSATACGRPPYGETTFNNATGRCSNGYLIIDYLAMAAGLPLLPPYKDVEADFGHGVNFAVAGSTALSTEVLAAKNVSSPVTNSSLDVQFDWMSTHLNSTCLDPRDCVEKLQNALFVVGEIGWNDYNYASFQNKTLRELTKLVPQVVDTVMDAVRKSIDLGATRIVVPGNLPIGCLPIHKTAFQTDNSAAYDENRCFSPLNHFAGYHNEKLQIAIEKLKDERPNAIVVYGDYYNAYKFLLETATPKGFDTEKACCGTGGKYNFNLKRMCGAPGVTVCPDPERYISWDGIHLTQEGYKIMSEWLLNDIFPKLNCPI